MKKTINILSILTTIFLITCNATSAPLGIGIMYLTRTDAAGDPIHNLSKDPEWTNPYVQGVALRTTWDRVEPTEGNFYWDYLDQGMALAAIYGKNVSILIGAGVTTPQWVFDAGAYAFMVTEQFGVVEPMPLPWDTVFQHKWSAFVQAFAARYGSDPNLVYVVMGGLSRRAQFFVTTSADQAAMDALAVSQGYTDGLAAWQRGAQFIINQYARQFPNVPFILDLAPPYPTSAGSATLQSICNIGNEYYPGRFGVKADSLAVNGPPVNSIAATEVTLLSPTSTVGYQMGLPQNNSVNLGIALNRGIDFGAHFIEVYPSDCNLPSDAQVLTDAAARMLAQ
jgi:hypothetical protein